MECRAAASTLFTLDSLDPYASTDDTSSARQSRRDIHLRSAWWPLPPPSRLAKLLLGAVAYRLPVLPPFPYDAMTAPRRPRGIPGTPRVISPSPTPSEPTENAKSSDASYTGPTTRSAARKRRATPRPVPEELDGDDAPRSPELRRSRTRSRSPLETRKITKLTPANGHGPATTNGDAKHANRNRATDPQHDANGKDKNEEAPSTHTNGHLSPTAPSTGWSWRDFSRSPSPLGLIPIHRHWRSFVHKHEVPRKALHSSIGLFVIWLYLSGTQTSAVCPYLLGALVPIAAADVLRHHHEPFNRFYVRVLGALMRESEYTGYNGVIFYLLGAWIARQFFPKDVGVVATLLLSWCDTAASTFGRLYGRYTPRIRRGKSLAGSLAAFLVGVGTAAWFWGWLVPARGPMPGDETFLFRGSLRLPQGVADLWSPGSGPPQQATISGALALGVVSVWSGLVAAASEVVDVFGWDDNLTIPVLSGLGIWGFLKVFC